jgi:Lon protease-like protein
MALLPLFPLNTVLFPGIPISLHIFEERYKLMINRCLDAQSPFGIVLLQSGSEVQGAGPTPRPYSIGCTAHIAQVQRLSMGRMNLIAVGGERFQINELNYTEPYLLGQVNYLSLSGTSSTKLSAMGTVLQQQVGRYLAAIAKVENISFDDEQLPSDPVQLSYLAASLARIPMAEKQKLLAINDAELLVQAVLTLYRKELVVLQILLSQSAPASETQPGVFSAN